MLDFLLDVIFSTEDDEDVRGIILQL